MNAKDRTDPLAVLEPLLQDPDIVEIMVDGPERVYVEKQGQFMDVSSPFRDAEHLMGVIDAILAPTGLKVDAASPMADARLVDGSRVNIVIPPVSLVGPVMTIRKFWQTPLSVGDLLRFGSWSEDIVEFLRACVLGRLNMVVAGGTGSGKTTVLNVIAGMIPQDERVVTVEVVSELQLLPDESRRVVRLECRPPNVEGKGEVTMRDLVINALRMRPDRIIAGEVRGGEALDLFQAMNTGHDGTMMTIHANSPHDVLTRLETMTTMANPSLPLLTVRQWMASALDLIVYQERMHDGKRRILKVTEVTGMQGDMVGLQDIFEFRQTGFAEGRVTGHFTATGQIPKFATQLREVGIELPLRLFTPT
jgi:pilus assembly protein CpaF